MPIPKEHLDVFNRHLRSSIVEATVEGGAYALRISVPNLESGTQEEVAEALEAAAKELRDSGQTVPRIKCGPITVLPPR
jgi:Asp-tRNA(Asn)/Glu-tRNA(Gln) amidotransferase A subunit family amidase